MHKSFDGDDAIVNVCVVGSYLPGHAERVQSDE